MLYPTYKCEIAPDHMTETGWIVRVRQNYEYVTTNFFPNHSEAMNWATDVERGQINPKS